jgi:hypothetical protein
VIAPVAEARPRYNAALKDWAHPVMLPVRLYPCKFPRSLVRMLDQLARVLLAWSSGCRPSSGQQPLYFRLRQPHRRVGLPERDRYRDPVRADGPGRAGHHERHQDNRLHRHINDQDPAATSDWDEIDCELAWHRENQLADNLAVPIKIN